MKQSIMILRGNTYNYCEEVRFYYMIGLLSEIGEFQGIEMESQNETDPLMVLKNYNRANIKLVSGLLSDTFDYFTVDLSDQKISSGRLKVSDNNHQYTGSEFIYDESEPLIMKEILYKVGTRKIIIDETLETMISLILQTNQKNKQLVKKV